MPERLDDLTASFRLALRAEGKSEATVRVYSEGVRSLTAWLAAQNRPLTSESLSRHAITAWLADLAASRSAGTCLTRYKGVQRFVRWCVLEDVLAADPTAGMRAPAVPERPVPVVTDDELSALLKTTAGTTFAERRDHAVLRVLLDTGCRISECAGLTLADLDLEQNVGHVIGKGRRPRALVFGSKTARSLDRYLRARRAHPYAYLPALWLGQRGRLGKDGLDDMLRVRARQAGVVGFHAHRLRHTAAHSWLSAGGQEQDLMRLMGWRSPTMLARYGASKADERARDSAKRLGLGDRV